MPDPVVRSDIATAVAGFGVRLRRVGVACAPQQLGLFQTAIGRLPPGDSASLYWAGRSCLGVRPEMTQRYDTAFAEYFLGLTRPREESDPEPNGADPGFTDSDQLQSSPADVGRTDAGADGDDDESAERAGEQASTLERLRRTPFERCTGDELLTIARLVRELRIEPAQTASRRLRPGVRHRRIDLRATARNAMRTNGEMVLPYWREPAVRAHDVVLLIDVSQSMGPYARMMLHFGYALARARRRSQVICFGTRATNVTRALRAASVPSVAIERATALVWDWGGGTRISSSLADIQRLDGLRGRLRGATVLIASDGLEQGDPSELAAQMSRLRRTSSEVIWLNPLAGDPRYVPLARGMAAALPYVDALLAADSVDALARVAARLKFAQANTAASARWSYPCASATGALTS